MTKNQKGVALVYVLIAFVFVGAVGSLVLNVSRKEKTDGNLRASTEMARFSANAGLAYAASFFTNPANEAEAKKILNDWYNGKDEKLKWIAGSEKSFSDTNKTNGMRFRAEIINVDFSQFNDNDLGNPINIMFRSEAIDKSGSRAENTGVYKILGFEPPEEIVVIPELNALDMRGGLNEINTRVIVNGGTYFEDGTTGSGGAINFSNHQFNGQFRRMARVANANLTIRSASFGGVAYFGSLAGITPPPVEFGGAAGAVVFKSGLGSESVIHQVGTAGIIVEKGNVYLNNSITTSGGAAASTWRFNDDKSVLQGRTGRVYSAVDWQNVQTCNLTPQTRCLVSSSSPKNPQIPNLIGEMNIPALLNLKPTPPPLTLDWSVLPPAYPLNQSNVSGATLNTIYNNHKNGTQYMFNGWVVVEMTGPESPISSSAGTFDGKMILILNRPTAGSYGFSFQSRFPVVSQNGRIVIIVRNNTAISRLGNSGTIRGMVINEGNGELLLGAPTTGTNRDMTINGAVHSMGPGALRLEGGDGSSLTINFDKDFVGDMLKELKGFINISKDNNKDEEPKLGTDIRRKTGVPVSAEMRSRGY